MHVIKTNLQSGLRGPLGRVVIILLGLIPLLLSAAPAKKISLSHKFITFSPAPHVAKHPKTFYLVGDPLPRIQCVAGYTASIYAEGLSSPDGLAFGPDGVLYVAEELAGEVSRIDPDGDVTPIMSGLTYPEGLAFDSSGNLYVVEDVENGRLIRRSPTGIETTMASGLDAPEGVRVSNGVVYVTESNIQFITRPYDLETRITAVTGISQTTPVRIDPLTGSYAGITIGSDHLLYVTNEISGNQIPGTDITPTNSIYTVDPDTGARTLFASNLVSPEGLNFVPNGDFPLYVAEEDASGINNGQLSRVLANGSHSPFCTGFDVIEDVIQDSNGRLFVSEDGTGLIILLQGIAAIPLPKFVYLPVLLKK